MRIEMCNAALDSRRGLSISFSALRDRYPPVCEFPDMENRTPNDLLVADR
jgi:hypothetical protein